MRTSVVQADAPVQKQQLRGGVSVPRRTGRASRRRAGRSARGGGYPRIGAQPDAARLGRSGSPVPSWSENSSVGQSCSVRSTSPAASSLRTTGCTSARRLGPSRSAGAPSGPPTAAPPTCRIGRTPPAGRALRAPQRADRRRTARPADRSRSIRRCRSSCGSMITRTWPACSRTWNRAQSCGQPRPSSRRSATGPASGTCSTSPPHLMVTVTPSSSRSTATTTRLRAVRFAQAVGPLLAERCPQAGSSSRWAMRRGDRAAVWRALTGTAMSQEIRDPARAAAWISLIGQAVRVLHDLDAPDHDERRRPQISGQRRTRARDGAGLQRSVPASI